MPIQLRPLLAILLVLPSCAPSLRVHPRAADEIAKGYEYLSRDDLERADVAFAHALEFNGDVPEALNGAGVVARRLGDVRRARRLFRHAVSVSPDFAEGWVNLGEIDLADEDDQAAEDDFREALRIDPDLVVARLDLARCLLHRGRRDPAHRDALWTAARRAYLHLLEARPDVAEAHHDLAFMDYEAGRWGRAAEEYRRAAELAPGYVEALHGSCISLARMGQCDDAARACRRCLEVAPSSARCETSLRAASTCSANP